MSNPFPSAFSSRALPESSFGSNAGSRAHAAVMKCAAGLLLFGIGMIAAVAEVYSRLESGR